MNRPNLVPRNLSDPFGIVDHMFDDGSAGGFLTVVEDAWRAEAQEVARRLTAVASLMWQRTEQALEDPTDDDPGYALITGFKRAALEVGAALNLDVEAASAMVGHAEVLDTRLPKVAGLLGIGHLDWATCKAIITRTELVDTAVIGVVDTRIADQLARWRTWSRRRVLNLVDKVILDVDPDAAKERRVTADTRRYLKATAGANGMSSVRGSLPAPLAVIAFARADALGATVCPNDPRTPMQRRVDAFAVLGESSTLPCRCGRDDCTAPTDEQPAAPTASAVGVVINVIASRDTITGASEDPGYLEGHGVIDADQVRDLAATATLQEVSEPEVTDAQAERYRPSVAAERWVRCRDLLCSWPGCDRPAWRADIDHTTPFDHQNPGGGGLTGPWNTKCDCRYHHLAKTFLAGPDGWQDVQLPDGTVILTSPTGREYRVAPAGVELFPQLGTPRTQPVAHQRVHRTTRRKAKAQARDRKRRDLQALRPANVEQRRINRARAAEIAARQWRNQMRKTLLVLKGGHPSTSPWCTWANDPPEDPTITADWLPPPKPATPPDGDEPPF